MILMAAQQKRENEKSPENPEVVWIQIWIEGITDLLDWESEHNSFYTQIKNDDPNDLAAADKEARRMLL